MSDTGITKEQVYEIFSDFNELKEFIKSREDDKNYTRQGIAEELTEMVIASNPELDGEKISFYTLREIIRYVCPKKISKKGGRPLKKKTVL